MVLKVISLLLILAVVCSQVFAAPTQAPENETWEQFKNRIPVVYRDSFMSAVTADGRTEPPPYATRDPNYKQQGGQAAEDGNNYFGWGWGMPWGGMGWGGMGWGGWGWGK